MEGQRRKPAYAGRISNVTQAGRDLLMKSLNEYLAYYDPMRESNERDMPEDQATLRYSRVSVIADGKVIGASLYPDHVLDMAFLETPFMRQICRCRVTIITDKVTKIIDNLQLKVIKSCSVRKVTNGLIKTI